MSRRMRTYFYAVLGAIGGLIGWQVSNVLGLSFTANLYMSEAVVGALVGLCIGLFIGITEGLMTRNIVQAIKAGGFSGLLGLVAGAIGLPLSEFLFQTAGAGYLGRALGWGLFGLLIGLAEGVVGKSQVWKGMLGGLIGGALGGILLEAAHDMLKDPLTGKASGLVLLGASVGAFISLIVVLLSRAWLEVTSGKLKGTEFILDKFIHAGGPAIAIGSSALKAEIVLPDPDIAPQHAMLMGDGKQFTVKDMSLSGTFINNKKIELARLVNGQKIRMGNTEMVYHEKR
ncbi:MAG: FHA domain-containing protein [Anaerolineales bacterium]